MRRVSGGEVFAGEPRAVTERGEQGPLGGGPGLPSAFDLAGDAVVVAEAGVGNPGTVAFGAGDSPPGAEHEWWTCHG